MFDHMILMANKISITVLIVHIFIGVTGVFTFRCPPREQWSFRAKSTCPSLSYFCLLDLNFGIYKEQCRADASVESPGYKRVFAGDLHGIRCTHDRYQPFRFWTNKNSDCVYLKSLCNDEGQVVHEDGKSDVDRKCRCDYRYGYDYVTKPRNTCYCIPSEEDCSCYRKYCSPGELLDPDYECRNTNNWKATFGCSTVNTVPHVTEAPPVLMTVVQTDDKTVSRPLVEIKILGCIVIFYIGLCLVICLLHDRGEVDTKTKYVYVEVKQEVVPQNVKDFQVETIEKWREQLQLFVATKSSSSVATCLQSVQCVIITGPPGCGKTFTAYSVTMEMVDREEYELLIIEDPNDIIRYSRQGRNQLMFIDNIIGKYSVNDYNTGWWKYHEQDVRDLLSKNPNLRIIATCRSYIYNLHDKYVCMFFHHLSFLSKDIRLTIDERRQIGRQYTGNKINSIGDETISLYNFFPELCKRFNLETDEMSEFNAPCGYFTKELDILMNKLVEVFILLSLMVISNNYMTEAILNYYLHGNDAVVQSLLSEAGVNSVHVVSIRHLKALCGTYFTNTNGIYTFETRQLFDVVTYSIWKFIQETALRFGTCMFLKDKCILECLKESDFDLGVTVTKELEGIYFDRMLTRIMSGQFTDEFSHWKHKCDAYRHKTLEYLKKDSRYTYKGLIDIERNLTILHVVSGLGYIDYVDFFADLEPERINSENNIKRTPLHLASLKGHELVINSLIKRNALIDISDTEGNTPLDLACREGHIAIVSLLLNNKAAIKQNPKLLETPLFTVCKNGDFKLAKILIEANANVNVRDQHMSTPLFWTVKEGFTDITQLLLDNNANKDAVDNRLQTPLHHACAIKNVEMVKLLIENGANVSVQNIKKELPLHIACRNGCCGIAALLTSVKCNINHQDEHGNTPLYLACCNGYLDIATLLLEKQANANIANNSESTPLHTASKKGFVEIAQVLLEHNADIALQNKLKETPLHLACCIGCYDIVSSLLGKCDIELENKKRVRISKYINQKDKSGNTPLHYACYKGSFEVVKLLIGRGADADVANDDKCKAVDVATQRGFPDISKYLSTSSK